VFPLLLLTQSAPTGSLLGGMLPILAIFAIFYFLLFMPMQRQKKQQRKMLEELKNGDTVMTNGGIIGSIVKLEDDQLTIRVKPDNIKIQIARSAVSSLVGQDDKE
jgi:preprotein translocase subunit YajC